MAAHNSHIGCRSGHDRICKPDDTPLRKDEEVPCQCNPTPSEENQLVTLCLKLFHSSLKLKWCVNEQRYAPSLKLRVDQRKYARTRTTNEPSLYPSPHHRIITSHHHEQRARKSWGEKKRISPKERRE